MTNSEFNEKYAKWLDEGHYGCDIYNEECIKWLDIIFENVLTRAEDFKFQQIKWKFNKARFYADNSPLDTRFIEQQLNRIANQQ